MNLSEHFTLQEFTRTENRDLLQANIDIATNDAAIRGKLTRVAKELLEPIRGLFLRPIHITSGFRHPALNARVGGSPTSQHRLGEAADFVISGYETQEKQVEAVLRIAKELPGLQWGQLLVEAGCIHISLGSKREIAYYDVPTKTKRAFTL
jgi:uncharacterized protein YcbK (DUF882 family)